MDPASDAPMPWALESNTHRHSRGVLLLTTNCTSGQLLFMNGNVRTSKTLGTAGHTRCTIRVHARSGQCLQQRATTLPWGSGSTMQCSAAQSSAVL